MTTLQARPLIMSSAPPLHDASDRAEDVLLMFATIRWAGRPPSPPYFAYSIHSIGFKGYLGASSFIPGCLRVLHRKQRVCSGASLPVLGMIGCTNESPAAMRPGFSASISIVSDLGKCSATERQALGNRGKIVKSASPGNMAVNCPTHGLEWATGWPASAGAEQQRLRKQFGA